MYQVCVETIYAGKGDGMGEENPVDLVFETDSVTLRKLIEKAVSKQVDELNKRYGKEADVADRLLKEQYLSEKDVDEMAKEGCVSLAVKKNQNLKKEDCIVFAFSGFKRKRFFVLVNGTRPGNIEDMVVLLPNTKVQFVRIMPLVGG